ncbi:hypothetical protein AB1L30_01260 [Bremerella sp. JC817]|uniref:hypothetical protein n=1 Tax=Bremerella sp. JC817 TaxID=3231756 RepID=UPI00345A4E90
MSSAKTSVNVSMHMKRMFFDRPAVIRSIEPGKLKVLRTHAGAIRKTARRSMKRVSKAAKKKSLRLRQESITRGDKVFRDPTVSRPGRPPKIHTEGKFSPKLILFGYDKTNDVVIVGPVRTNSLHNAVQTLEHGGRVPVYMGSRRKRRLVKSVFVKARPFMRPAEEELRPTFQAKWANIQQT